MMELELLNDIPLWLSLLFIILALWESIWKGLALWKCGKNNQLVWFVCIFIFNTVGILPILYILFFQRKHVRM
jgi:hypothetical protein